MKKWILIMLLALGCQLHAKDTDQKDDVKLNLLRKLNAIAPNDTARLGVYYKLIRTAKTPEVERYYIGKLLSEAETLNSNKYKCRAYLSYMILAYNQYDAKEVNKWMLLLEPLAKQEKLYDFFFLGRRCVIDMLMLSGEYEREEKEALQMLKEAKELDNKVGIMVANQCLSNVYRMTYRNKEAAKVLEDAYLIAHPSDKSRTLELSNSLMTLYEALKDHPNWLKWTRELDNNLKRRIAEDPDQEESLQGWLLLSMSSYIRYYTVTNNLPNAANYVQLAKDYNTEGYSAHSYNYHMACYNYYYSAELFEQALAEITTLANIYKGVSALNYSQMIFFKANTLERLNRDDEAISTYQSAFHISDSISIDVLNKQTEQLKKDYNTEMLALEKEKNNRNLQLLYLGIATIGLLTLIAFVVHTYRIRKKLQASEAEMRKMAKDMDAANVAKEKFLSTISTAISEPLTSVVTGSLQLATDEVTDKEERQHISQNLNKTSAELMELINNILGLSKMEAGMMKFRSEELEIFPFIYGIVNLSTSRGQEVKTQLPVHPVPVKVCIDIARLQEVFNNLLGHVVQHKELLLEAAVNEQQQKVSVTVTGCNLAAYKEQPQKIAIANEMNRLLIVHFGGHYNVDVETCAVSFTLPLL